jgi:thiosulfate reductase cytochrome b subunit
MRAFFQKHRLAIRFFHWINFPVLFVMVWSGLLIYWANDVYRISVNGEVVFSFFPDSFYTAFRIPYRLAEGMAWHFTFMWLFAINGFLYVAFTVISGDWKYLLPDRKAFRDAWLVVLHELWIKKSKPDQIKYNAAQRIAYTVIVIMGFGSVLTGLVIYKPAQFPALTTLLGGYETARLEHFILTIGFVLFFFIHVSQVILAGWNNFRGMITGWEIRHKDGRNPSNEKPLQ